MNNQHLLVTDIAELKNSNPAVQYSLGPNTYIGMSNLISIWSPGGVVKEITIHFSWRMRVYILNNSTYALFRNSLEESVQLTLENPVMIKSGDPLILAGDDIQKLTLTKQLSNVFTIREMRVRYEKQH